MLTNFWCDRLQTPVCDYRSMPNSVCDYRSVSNSVCDTNSNSVSKPVCDTNSSPKPKCDNNPVSTTVSERFSVSSRLRSILLLSSDDDSNRTMPRRL